MSDLDQLIVRALEEGAEGSVDTDRLLTTAATQGKGRRRRRRVAAGAALSLGAVLGVGATINATGVPVATPWQGGSPSVPVAVPPRLTDTPGAAQQPDLVGTNPEVLHFGLDPAKARYLSWEAEPGLESIRLSVGGDQEVVIGLARSPEHLDKLDHEEMPPPKSAFSGSFNGQVQLVDKADRGDASGWVMRWKPTPGLFAQALTVGRDGTALRQAAAALQLNAAYRCAAPLRVTELPTNARVFRCTVQVKNYPAGLQASIVLNRPVDEGDKRLEIKLEYASGIVGNRTEGNRMVGNRAAYLYPQGRMELLGFPQAHLVATFGWPYQGFSEADAAAALDGAQIADDITQPSTWSGR